MLEVIGWLALCLINTYFSLMVHLSFWYGGGDCGPLFTSWGHWKWKLLWIITFIINVLFWNFIYNIAPFTMVMQ